VKLDFADGVWGGNEVLDMLDMTDDYDGRADLRIESRETKKPYPSHLYWPLHRADFGAGESKGIVLMRYQLIPPPACLVLQKQLLIVGFILS